MKKKFIYSEAIDLKNRIQNIIDQDLIKDIKFGLQIVKLKYEFENKTKYIKDLINSKIKAHNKNIKDKSGIEKRELLKKTDIELDELKHQEIEIDYKEIEEKDISKDIKVYDTLFVFLNSKENDSISKKA